MFGAKNDAESQRVGLLFGEIAGDGFQSLR